MSWTDQTIFADSCARTMKYNNNQGFLNISGGPPASNIIDYSGSNDGLELTYKAVAYAPVPQDPPWYV